MSDFKHENLQGEISHRYDRPRKGRKKYTYSIVSPLFPPFMAPFCNGGGGGRFNHTRETGY